MHHGLSPCSNFRRCFQHTPLHRLWSSVSHVRPSDLCCPEVLFLLVLAQTVTPNCAMPFFIDDRPSDPKRTARSGWEGLRTEGRMEELRALDFFRAIRSWALQGAGAGGYATHEMK